MGRGGWRSAEVGGKAASGALVVWGALSTIDDALAKLEKAQTGSVAPQVAKAINAFEARYPPTEAVRRDVLWYTLSVAETERNYPSATAWLHQRGVEALLVKGDVLKTMGDKLNTVRNYAWDQEKLESRFEEERDEMAPLLKELNKRTRVLYDIVQELEGIIPKLPVDTAQVTLFGIRDSFWDAAQDLGHFQGIVSAKYGERDRDYQEARTRRREAARVLNYWSPAWATILAHETGRKVTPTFISED